MFKKGFVMWFVKGKGYNNNNILLKIFLSSCLNKRRYWLLHSLLLGYEALGPWDGLLKAFSWTPPFGSSATLQLGHSGGCQPCIPLLKLQTARGRSDRPGDTNFSKAWTGPPGDLFTEAAWFIIHTRAIWLGRLLNQKAKSEFKCCYFMLSA